MIDTYSLQKPSYLPVSHVSLTSLEGKGKYLQTMISTLRRMDGTLFEYEVLAKRDPVVVLPITKNHEAILIDQFRYPLMDWELECPAGMPDEGETFEQAAVRELQEEIGYKVGRLLDMGKFASSGGTTTEVARLFLALDCEYVPGSLSRESDECIVVNRVPMNQVVSFLEARQKQGQSMSPKMTTLLWRYIFSLQN
jgi:ADP-ribose pyrophosphatase